MCVCSEYSPGLPNPDNASAASRTSGSSIDTTLVARPFLSSMLITLEVSTGLAIETSVPRSPSELRPGSIRGRLRTDCGDCGCALCRGADMCSNSGDSTVLRSGSRTSLGDRISCLGTVGHSTLSGDRESTLGGLSWRASMLAHRALSALIDVGCPKIVRQCLRRHGQKNTPRGEVIADVTHAQDESQVWETLGHPVCDHKSHAKTL